jgi:hypothetical protein
MDKNFIICSHEINFRKDGATRKVVGVVLCEGVGIGRGFCERSRPGNIHTASNHRPSWARNEGRMTMVPRHVGMHRPATWSPTRPWSQPSGQESGGVGGRLLEGRLLCGCGVVPPLQYIPVGLVSSGNSSSRLSGVVPPAMAFRLGTDGDAVWLGVE